MKLIYSDHFKKRLAKRLRQDSTLKSKVSKQLHYLQANPSHPSLRSHKLQGKRAHEHALWIKKNIRITYVIMDDNILLTDIITHDEY